MVKKYNGGSLIKPNETLQEMLLQENARLQDGNCNAALSHHRVVDYSPQNVLFPNGTLLRL